METLHIACCTDSHYLKYCLTMLLSLSEQHIGEDVHVHILGNGLSDSEIGLLHESSGFPHSAITHYSLDGATLKKLPQGIYNYISPTTYARLFLSEILPKELHRVIYLDCDLIVVDSLRPLWEYDLQEAEIGAVEDCGSGDLALYQRLKMTGKHPYFNAGVLLIDLNKWRNTYFIDRALEYIKNNASHLIYADQDVLNVLCEGKTCYLPFRFNLYEPLLRKKIPFIRREALPTIPEARNLPAVIHFTYVHKPWYYRCCHPYNALFYHYFDRTPWKGERPTPTWRDRLYRWAWLTAARFHLVNIYMPLPEKMKSKMQIME